MAAMAAGRLLGFSIFGFSLILRHFVENSYETLFNMPKLQYNQKNMNKYQFLIIFIQTIESLTANFIFRHFYDDVISADVTLISVKGIVQCRGIVVQKRFAIGQEIKILG